jgi:hypothetical protein
VIPSVSERMFDGMNRREQGDFGELSAMEWLVGVGAALYLPLGHSPDCDLIAELDGRLLRVQVKTSGVRRNKHRWDVSVCTRGGNQSWSGLVKRMDSSRCDFLFVHVADGRRWFIPSAEVGGGTKIRVGGPRYAEFEIVPGRPFPATGRDRNSPLESRIPSPGGCPSGQRECAVNASAMPTQVRILLPPFRK